MQTDFNQELMDKVLIDIFTKPVEDYFGLCQFVTNRLKEEFKESEITIFTFDLWKEEYIPFITTSPTIKSNLQKYKISRTDWQNASTNSKEHYKSLYSDYIIGTFQNDSFAFAFILLGNKVPLQPNATEWIHKLVKNLSHFMYQVLHSYQLERQSRRYEQLYNVTDKFHSTMKIEEVLSEIIGTLRKAYPTFDSYLILSHDHISSETLPIKYFKYGQAEDSAIEKVYLTGQLHLEDTVKDKKSILYVPLKGKQGIYGVLQIISPGSILFPTDDIEFISFLANTGGNAFENAELYQQSQRLISELKLINKASHRLNSNLSLSDTVEFMTTQIKKSFHADEVVFLLCETNKDFKILSQQTGIQIENLLPLLQEVNRRLWEESESLFIGDTESENSFPNSGYHSMMAVPMIENQALRGVAIVLRKEAYKFSFNHFKLLQSLIHHSTLAFINSILHEKLEEMVITDDLTKLFSRTFLNQKIMESMNKHTAGCLILMDIDNFKSINDQYGHQVGDQVLVQVGEILKNNSREGDTAARWGGEELAIYLPNVDLTYGKKVAQRIVQRIPKNTNPKITISCGISAWSREQGIDSDQLFISADQALYEAKNTGKNKVVIK